MTAQPRVAQPGVASGSRPGTAGGLGAALTIPGLLAPVWMVRDKSDPAACALADRHYSRVRPGSGQIGQPGRKLVLVTPDERAVWLTVWPAYVSDELDAWRCSIFRNERSSAGRSSDLIRAAMALTARLWLPRYGPPRDAWVTWIDDTKTASPNPGYCFKCAGWRSDGRTARRGYLRLRAELRP